MFLKRIEGNYWSWLEGFWLCGPQATAVVQASCACQLVTCLSARFEVIQHCVEVALTLKGIVIKCRCHVTHISLPPKNPSSNLSHLGFVSPLVA